MNNARFFAILGFILLGIFSRFLPHPPNFTAINAIALFGACSIGSLSLSLLSVFAAVFFSDLIIGFHSNMPFVYFSFGLTVLLGHWLKREKFQHYSPFFLIASSIQFFVITNFGVWLTDCLYPKTFLGMECCYLAAIPFIANQIFGDLFYGVLLFGCFALVERFIPAARTLIHEKI